MRAPSWLEEFTDRLRMLGPFAVLIRMVAPTAALVSWVTAGAVGGFNGFLGVLLVLTAIAAAAFPDSTAPLILILVMTGSWFLEVDPFSLPWSIVLALCILVVHVASARAAALVPGTAYDRGTTMLWLRQTGLVAVATVGVWVVSVRLGESPGGSSVAVSAVAVVAIAALGVGLILATSSDSDD